MSANKCLHENVECTRCGDPTDDEFTRGERHAEKGIAAWLREVAETMSHNGEGGGCGIVEDLAAAIESGEWKN
jgi:hypothetical protein